MSRRFALAVTSAAALVLGGLAASSVAGRPTMSATRTIGTSIDRRDVVNGEQLLVTRGGEVIDAV
jgi:hypothetical protein